MGHFSNFHAVLIGLKAAMRCKTNKTTVLPGFVPNRTQRWQQRHVVDLAATVPYLITLKQVCLFRYYFSPYWKHWNFLIDGCQLIFQLLCVIIIHSYYIVRSIIHQWSNGTRLHMPHFSYHLLLWHWWLMGDMPLLLLRFRVRIY